MEKLLVLENISHSFANVTIFEQLNMAVAKNEVVSIVGASGVGKTTLFNIAAGLLVPSKGKVWINGVDTTGVAGTVGYMLQKDLLLPFKSVYANIALPLTIRGLSKSEISAMIFPKLNDFGLEGLEHKYPQNLSGGQRQRAALLRTYLSDKPIMLLDEPFSALDFVTKDGMYQWFSDLQNRLSLTCLIITHDIDEAIYLSDQVYVLKGSPAHLTNSFRIQKYEGFLQSQDYLKLKKDIFTAIQS